MCHKLYINQETKKTKLKVGNIKPKINKKKQKITRIRALRKDFYNLKIPGVRFPNQPSESHVKFEHNPTVE